jgi:hypothetical protein
MKLKSGIVLLNYLLHRTEMIPRFRLTRQALHALVWAQPMTKVAVRFGISDVGLKKICVKHRVPVPRRGYLAKVAAGKPVKPGRFVPLNEPALDQVRIYGAPESQLLPNIQQARREAIDGEKAPEKRITVNSENRALHPMAALTLKTLRKRKPGHQGLVTASGTECFNVSGAPPNVERAVQILDALAYAAEERGYAIERTENAACLRINGERIELELRETIVRQPHRRTPEEMVREERAKNSRSGAHELAPWEPRWDHLASGKLVLQLAEKYHTGLRRMWSDGKRQRIENLLNDFLAGR